MTELILVVGLGVESVESDKEERRSGSKRDRVRKLLRMTKDRVEKSDERC